MELSKTAFVGLGGNVGDVRATFSGAVEDISSRCGTIVRVSSLYETLPLKAPGKEREPVPHYLNAVLELRTYLEAEELLVELLRIERIHGRDRRHEERWSSRSLDLDLLAVDSLMIESGNLTLPHPEVPNRDFVLIPFAEIAPRFHHPKLLRTVQELKDAHLASDNPRFVIRNHGHWIRETTERVEAPVRQAS